MKKSQNLKPNELQKDEEWRKKTWLRCHPYLTRSAPLPCYRTFIVYEAINKTSLRKGELNLLGGKS